jgi:hypothetical protein
MKASANLSGGYSEPKSKCEMLLTALLRLEWIFPVSVPNLKSTGRGHFHRAIFVSGLYSLQEISTVS